VNETPCGVVEGDVVKPHLWVAKGKTVVECTTCGRTISQKDCRETVFARADGACEVRVPGWCQGRAREFQHRLPTGRRGLWVPSNGLAVCGHGNADGCHGYIHQHPTIAIEKGWTVETGVDPALKPVELWMWGHMQAFALLDDDGDFHFHHEAAEAFDTAQEAS
jgi:hypothetical protein